MFALGGVAAALAGVLSGVYFGAIDPHQGTALLIFAFIVVVIGGLGSILGSAAAAVVVGLLQQWVNYYSRGRRPLGRPAARGDAARPAERPRRTLVGGALRRAAGVVIPLAVFALLLAVPRISLDTHGVFSSPLDSPGTLQLLGLCSCSAASR